MIDLAKNTMNGKPIKEWKVWFMTPFGPAQELTEAVQAMNEFDMDPITYIKPIPVAFDEDGHYEYLT